MKRIKRFLSRIAKRALDKFSNYKLKRKLILVNVAIAVFVGLAIGTLGVTDIISLGSMSLNIYNQDLVPSSSLNKIQSDFQSINIGIRDMALSANADGTSADVRSLNTDISKQLNIYAKQITAPDAKDNYELLKNEIQGYDEYQNSLLTTIQNGDVNGAIIYMSNAGKVLTDQLGETISDAYQLNIQHAKEMNGVNDRNSILAVLIMLMTVVAFILLSLFVSSKVSNSISVRINDLVLAAGRIAEGNLDEISDAGGSDEIGALSIAFRKVASSLRMLKDDVDSLISAALEGKLDIRVDADRHKGAYGEIVSGINKTLDAVKTPLDSASDYIDRLADGEHLLPVENDFKGYYARLMDNIDKVVISVNILGLEAQKLSAAGRDGNLDQRGDDSELKGVYADIINGVNQTFDAFKEPLDIASDFIKKLAAGDVGQEIPNDFTGYYAALIDNLNHVQRSIRYLEDESARLVLAGINGDLSVRGEFGELKGGYSDIITGFNKTLDAITLPLKEADEVLGKMSVNNLSQNMSLDYNGAFKTLADSINAVNSNLHFIEEVFMRVAQGDQTLLDECRGIGKKSENDRMIPLIITMSETLHDLIEESNMLAQAAVGGKIRIHGHAEKFVGGYKEIIIGINRTLDAAANPISEASATLRELAEGNLMVSMQGDYMGDYDVIKKDMNHALDSFNMLLIEINSSVVSLAACAGEISDGSQSLSQGSAEQAGAIENLSSTIGRIAEKTANNAENANRVNQIFASARENIMHGSSQMQQMLEAMRSISESSTKISKIIKLIDDIAFQTNILAINATVEAARAGQAGRSFSVVAQEVKNLAGRSANAASETSELIEKSKLDVEAGMKIAENTARSLNQIMSEMDKTAKHVDDISAASKEQATDIMNYNVNLEQISQAVQTNSATTEQSAAASQELADQAATLKKMVGQFKLRSHDGDSDQY